jgi:hypothetical protein
VISFAVTLVAGIVIDLFLLSVKITEAAEFVSKFLPLIIIVSNGVTIHSFIEMEIIPGAVIGNPDCSTILLLLIGELAIILIKTREAIIVVPKIIQIFFRVISPLARLEKAVGLISPTIKKIIETKNIITNKFIILKCKSIIIVIL